MVTTRSISKLNKHEIEKKNSNETSGGNLISNKASNNVLKKSKNNNCWSRVPAPIEFDTPVHTSNSEAQLEIELAAVCANLNNRITELSEQYDMLYKVYITERKKREYYQNLCRSYESNIHAHQYL